MKKENADWKKKHGSLLWEITQDGYSLVDQIGCFLEDWEESPEGCCEMWANELDYEFEVNKAWLAREMELYK